MSDESAAQTSPPKCPICGAAAEAGCIYGPDGWTGLRWRPGAPSFWGNVETGLFGGEAIGEWGLLRGPYIEGIRCEHCKRVVLQL
jgi:hypothetical protein